MLTRSTQSSPLNLWHYSSHHTCCMYTQSYLSTEIPKLRKGPFFSVSAGFLGRRSGHVQWNLDIQNSPTDSCQKSRLLHTSYGLHRSTQWQSIFCVNRFPHASVLQRIIYSFLCKKLWRFFLSLQTSRGSKTPKKYKRTNYIFASVTDSYGIDIPYPLLKTFSQFIPLMAIGLQ